MTVDPKFPPIQPDDTTGIGVFEQLDHLVQAQPQQTIVECQRMLREQSDPAVTMGLWAVIGRALYELGDLPRAKEAMRKALQDGANLAAGDRLTRVRVSAAAIFAEGGEMRAALEQLDLAELGATGSTLGRVRSQRAFVLTHAGRLVEARRQADLAEHALLGSGDRLALLRLMINRSLVDLQLGELAAAEANLLKAGRLADRLGQAVSAALIVGNLGVLHARAGRTMRALEHFDRAHEMYVAAGSPLRTMAVLEADRAESLWRAGLFDNAVTAAHVAVAHATASGNLVSRGDAELLLARALLAAGALGAAKRTALAAAALLRSGHRGGMALQARAIGLQAALGSATSDSETTSLLGRSRRLGERLEREGWKEMSDDLRCARLRSASRLGRLDDVTDDLAALRQSLRSRRPGVALRAWYAESLARDHGGDARAAMGAARRGMKALDRHRRSNDELQIRAGLSATGDDLASLAVHMAVATGSPSVVFAWAERTRANAYGFGEQPDAVGLSVPSLAAVSRQLGSRVLVEFVIDGDQISAVVVRRSRSRLVALGQLDEVVRAVGQLTAWLDRATRPNDANRVGAAHSIAERLGRLLIGPLGLPPDVDVVIVPVKALHAVPWSSLPHLRASTVVVHLSAHLWLASDRRASEVIASSISLIIGPDVAGASVERAAIRKLYPRATIVAGRLATPQLLKSLLNRSDAVQIAAHGIFRPDRPLRSTLRLHGGEMAIHELNEVDVGSGLVVLSSCEGGVHGVNAGGEALGLVAILLSRGAPTVLAPINTVADIACAEFVADFHREWATGLTAAGALAIVRRRWLDRPTLADWATAAAFTCFGSGMSTFDTTP